MEDVHAYSLLDLRVRLELLEAYAARLLAESTFRLTKVLARKHLLQLLHDSVPCGL